MSTLKWKRVPGSTGDWMLTRFQLRESEEAEALLRFNRCVDDCLYPPFTLEVYNVTNHSDTQLLCVEFWAGKAGIAGLKSAPKRTTWSVEVARELIPEVFEYASAFAVRMNTLDKLRKL